MNAERTDSLPEHPSNFAFDRLAAGTLDEGARSLLEGHLETCSNCRDRRRSLDDDRNAFSLDDAFLAKLERGAPSGGKVLTFPSRRVVQGLVPTLAAAAAIAFVVSRKPTDETATKGSSIYEFFVKDAAGTRAVPRGAVVHTGDLVQVTRTGAAPGFVAVFSMDGKSNFTRFVPGDGAPELVAIDRGTRVALPASVQLDDVLGTERFIVVDCESPVALSLAEESARGGAAPPGCTIVSHPLEKR